MPYLVPNRQGNFGAGARGLTVYDNKGNFWGYFPTGRVPQCLPSVKRDVNCPVGALSPIVGKNACGCGSASVNGCYPASVPTCPPGSTSVSKGYAPWCSCNLDKGILF